ncbi:hypothetical protein Patl1_12814 [Pistacia atlantica]|uniref:Uncharacterized protein n=1 Tax=Pistacia atlantica TaxID=434234 RepID=A0ACC1AV10_9ROSI|nr:hypothetical protein Patl1_12814 [Pistacia atlantica]
MDHEENEKRLEELKSIIREQESRLHHLQSIAFQLANYYCVFQGVILTAICNGSTSLSCSDHLFLFTVSLLAATLNLVALCIMGLKYLRTVAQQDHNWCESHELQRRLLTILVLPRIQCHDPCKQLRRVLYFTVCMILFLGFAVVTLSGCWHIICRKYEWEKQQGNDK